MSANCGRCGAAGSTYASEFRHDDPDDAEFCRLNSTMPVTAPTAHLADEFRAKTEQAPSWLVAMAADDNRERLLQLRAFMIGIGEDPDDPVQWARRRRQYCAESVRQAQLASAGLANRPRLRRGDGSETTEALEGQS